MVLVRGIAYVCVASHPVIQRRGRSGDGWVINATDADVDNVAELVTGLSTTYRQLTIPDTIEILSSSTADTTQTVTVSGVDDDDGAFVTVDFTVDGTTAVDSTIVFRYVNQVWVDIECAGTITVRQADDNGFLNSITIGSLRADVAQHFNGDKYSYIERWWASKNTLNSVSLELRWYPDDADSLDAADGFLLLDRIYLAGTLYQADPHDFTGYPGGGIRCIAGGWMSVYATGSTANQEVSVTIFGFDHHR